MKDNENLQLDHKTIKSQLNSAKLDQTKLEAEFSKLKEEYQQLDITSTKLTNQCEVRRLSSRLFLLETIWSHSFLIQLCCDRSTSLLIIFVTTGV